MKIFRADPDAALEAERARLQQVEASMVRLQAERAGLLEATDGDDVVASVLKIDGELKKLEASAAVHRARILVLERQCREQAAQRREEARKAAIADIGKRLGRRQAAAAKLDQALAQLQAAFDEVIASDEVVFSGWPDLLPPAHRLRYLRATVIEPLSAMRKQRPPLAGFIRELVARGPYNIAAAIENYNRELLEELESAPLAEIEDVAA